MNQHDATRKTEKMDLRHKLYWIFGAMAFLYAIWSICRCALCEVNLRQTSPEKVKFEALFYLLTWTFGPPVWFMIDRYIFKHPPAYATDLTHNQKLAAAVWAAVFATILELVKPG